MGAITESLKRIDLRIQAAARRAGRDSNEITLIAASKGATLEAVREAAEGGVRVFGENRVQEAHAKFFESGYLSEKKGGVSLHLIGPLQTNKIKWAVGFFELIHSIDSLHLAEKVNQEAEKQMIRQEVLIEVNVGEEGSKRGVTLDEAPFLIEAVRQLPHLSLLGLMALPPYMNDPEQTRPYFSALRKTGEEQGLSRFSMGMSADFEIAIEEGATWVRIGTALFGPRPSDRNLR